MAVTPPALLEITPSQDLVLPAMDEQPLRRALENVNHLWQYFRPPLVDVCPTVAPAVARTITIVVPIVPSADGLRYTFRTEVVCSAVSTLTVDVDYCTAWTGLAASASPTAWTGIFATTSATPAGTRHAQTDLSMVIPATAIALKFEVSVAAGTISLHHLLVLPGAAAPTASGVQLSGYACFDDGILVALAGAPIHTEFLNRCKRSSRALLRDRRQMCFSFGQDEAKANMRAVLTGDTSGVDLPPVRCYFPGQGKSIYVEFSALVSLSAGAGGALVDVAQIPSVPSPPYVPQAIQFAGSLAGTLTTTSMRLYLEGPPGERFADIHVRVRTTAANSTYLHALTALWRPGDT